MHIIYITAPSKQEALKISHSLITDKLVACCNIIDSVTSVYEWEGEIKQEPECTIIAKTSAGLTENVIAHVKSIHPYDCPCIISIDTDKANHDFTKWVESCVRNRN